jgi:predicted RNase H-like HicB family nuclease
MLSISIIPMRSPLGANTKHCDDCTGSDHTTKRNSDRTSYNYFLRDVCRGSDRPPKLIAIAICGTIKVKVIISLSKINMMNLDLSQPEPFTNLKVTLLLEALTSGQVAASVREFPDCRVKAETREEAIAQIQATFLERLKNIEAISWNVPIQASEPTWMKFAGVFKNDSDFAAIMESIRAERTSDDNSEVDPSYYL